MPINRVPNEILLHIDEYNSISDTVAWNSVSFFYQTIFDINYCKLQYKFKKSKKILFNFALLFRAFSITKKLIVNRLLYDEEYRNTFFYLHATPHPHLCIRYEKIPRIVRKHIHGVTDLQRMATPHYDDLVEILVSDANFADLLIIH